MCIFAIYTIYDRVKRNERYLSCRKKWLGATECRACRSAAIMVGLFSCHLFLLATHQGQEYHAEKEQDMMAWWNIHVLHHHDCGVSRPAVGLQQYKWVCVGVEQTVCVWSSEMMAASTHLTISVISTLILSAYSGETKGRFYIKAFQVELYCLEFGGMKEWMMIFFHFSPQTWWSTSRLPSWAPSALQL